MHIVYFSPTGGTRKAAYIIGKEIDPQATEIDIADHTRQQNSYELNGEDTLLVAGAVLGGGSCVWRESSFRSHRSTETYNRA